MKFLPNLKNVKEPKKAAKCLAVFCALTLGIAAIFYSPSNLSSAQITQDCALLADNVIAEPGNNCLFSAMTPTGSKVLPLCQTIAGISYNISPDNIAPTGKHLVDCVNLSDLPVCPNPIVDASDKPGKTCVKTCGGSDVDHNRNCVRFCQSPEAGFTDTLVKDVNCIDKKCHQLAVGVSPLSSGDTANCTLTPCNLLTPKELIDVYDKISKDSEDSLVKYCEGAVDIYEKPLKCYNFNKEQLPYVIANRMCIMHNCPAPCANYISQTDTNGDGYTNDRDHNDTLNISDRGTDYVNTYIATINNNEPLTSTSYCVPTFCLPVVKKQFRCVKNAGDDTPTGDSSQDTKRHKECDDLPVDCTNNMCSKTIDCNLAANNSGPNAQLECAQTTDGSIGSEGDITDAWFYRPKPMNKATKIDDEKKMRHLLPMEFKNNEDSGNNICYTASQMEDADDNFEPDINGGLQPKGNKWGEEVITPELHIPYVGRIPAINLGWFHSGLLPDETRSPGLCLIKKEDNAGNRGTGYIYLCYGDGNPNHGQLYAKVASHTAYHKGYVRTTFNEGNAIHKLSVCLRFTNSMRPTDGTSETCGERECAVTCMGKAGGCSQESCGYDQCRDFTIADKSDEACEETLDASETSQKEAKQNCFLKSYDTSVIDTYLRLRVKKYGNRICSFLDVKGQTAYDNVKDLFMTGTEKLSDGTCISGASSNSSGNCSGQGSYTDPSLASVWRTIKFGDSGNIPYIQNNQVDRDSKQLDGAPRGYFSGQGEFFAEQECINIPLRIPPPRLYNLATSKNSPKLFTPPLYILNSLVEAGGAISSRNFDGSLGLTDFNHPAVWVNFGNTTVEMNLSFGVTGYEVEEGREELTRISTTINGITQQAAIFARKEFNETSAKPTFCIYRKFIDSEGNPLFDQNNRELPPERVGCVNRKEPEIDNSISRTIIPSLKPQQAIIELDSSSTFESSRIILRYLGGFGQNGANNKCALGSDDLCSSPVILENTNPSIPTCNSAIVDPNARDKAPPELNVVCALREECSRLNAECMQNEIDMQNAKVAGQRTDSFLIVRKTCETLLPMCNAKKGITTSNATITNTNPTGAVADPKYYGWFNEICIVGDKTKTNAFDSKLKRVLAHKTSTGLKGKCITLEPESQCPDGGKAPLCNCKLEDPNVTPTSAQEYRLQTHREAGLCVDMPLPQTCPAITYNPTSTIADDPNYIYSSLGQTSYGTSQGDITGKVHISHKSRNEAELAGHADFPLAILGSQDITGTCKGFWKNGNSSTGFSEAPTRTCENQNGNAVWSNTTKTPCERYSCPERTTSGAVSAAIGASYQGDYASSEIGDTKGAIDGFATWPSKLKTTDFLESVNAFACIPGFKKHGSTSVSSTPTTRTYETHITGYDGGNTPSRNCNQIGLWQTPTNSCERIKCPAITPPNGNPSTFTTDDWIKWYNAGGATFEETDASRSTADGIERIGVCNNNLGFFNLGAAPSRKCDYLGNWGPVTNPCTTRCEPITTEFAAGSNNGNATWSEALAENEGQFGGCINDHVPYPYSPLKDPYGNPYQLYRGSVTNYSDISGFTFTNTPSASSIPLKLSDDQRPAGNPRKFCRTLVVQNFATSVWAAANSSCIDSCPGYNKDPRIGVGTTQHDISGNPSKVTVKWESASFGKWHYFSSTDPNQVSQLDTPRFEGQDASSYSEGRTNHNYILARFCGDGSNGTTRGKWEEPIPQCATNGGIITQGTSSNAIYSNSTPGRPASSTVNVSDPATSTENLIDNAISTSCRTGFYPTGSDTATEALISRYQCIYKDATRKIDQVYFNRLSGQPCQVYCKPPAINTPFGNSLYTGTPAAPSHTAVGGVLELGGCATNYGKAPLYDSDPNTTDNSCGIANPDRGKTPKVTCQANGVFGNVTDNCTSCMQCSCSLGDCGNKPFPFIKDTSSTTRIVAWTYGQDTDGSKDDCFIAGAYSKSEAGSCGDDNDTVRPIYPGTVDNGSYIDVTTDGSNSNSVTYRFQCYDGLFVVTQTARSSAFIIGNINYTNYPRN